MNQVLFVTLWLKTAFSDAMLKFRETSKKLTLKEIFCKNVKT